MSHYGEIKHPNMMSEAGSQHFHKTTATGKSMAMYKNRRKKDCKYFLAKLDYEIIRPMLIYNYEREEMHRQAEVLDMIMNDVNIIGQVYGKVEPHILDKSHNEDERAQMRISQAIMSLHHEKNMRRSSKIGLSGRKFSKLAPAGQSLKIFQDQKLVPEKAFSP